MTTLQGQAMKVQGDHEEEIGDNIGEFRMFADTHGLITTTMNEIPQYRIVKVLGTVYGLSVRSRNIAAGTWTALRSVAGGELKSMTKLLYSSRDQAVERMVGECVSRGGNAIVALRFDTSELLQFAQVCSYGTACIVEPV
ncbi:YjfJ protein [Aaosphaeria arxii CBS 175.79]|uniref:YjfJ protein n=1 Tax=Aaosphaeria arxii CBS 175.79 TaxID=1450172 RepID=A0A6A5Y897_9PLEO|nr:YjfJ protein [Aaosphaeria arxii CBS 175.79]KAF2021618.1 YjfJ protein [Aaosphaeria arxii CBS 175.79]